MRCIISSFSLFFLFFSACPRGAPFMMCHYNPCEGASCPANPKAHCLPDNCGGCTAQFFDDNDNLVDCSASKYRRIGYLCCRQNCDVICYETRILFFLSITFWLSLFVFLRLVRFLSFTFSLSSFVFIKFVRRLFVAFLLSSFVSAVNVFYGIRLPILNSLSCKF